MIKIQITFSIIFFSFLTIAMPQDIGLQSTKILKLQEQGRKYIREEKYEKALDAYQKLLAILESIPPESDFREDVINDILSDSYSYISKALIDLRRYNEALQYLKQLQRLNFKIYDNPCEHVGECLIAMGDVYYLQEEYEKAINSYRKAEELFYEVLMPPHENFVALYCNLGNVLGGVCRFEEAYQCYNESLKQTQKLNMPQGTILFNMGWIELQRGANKEALEYFQNSLKHRKKETPVSSVVIADSYSYVGLSLSRLGRHREGLDFANKALLLLKEKYGDSHPKFANFYFNLGDIHLALVLCPVSSYI